ncbi:DUF1800 domain-containing protein [Planctobacterium marinum]|uniref:DUF1800 domain-containing protein n=1 Tax=Planctobacterium marinum TaxID=1631968 RepID=A0AA48HJJ7_9ALTE|nr:hypothetical protein MACH26_02830 [Planctobacterium marinum]
MLSFFYTFLTLIAANSMAEELPKTGGKPSTEFSQKAALYLSRISSEAAENNEFECDGDELCEAIMALCEDRQLCTILLQICTQHPDLCEEIIFEPECDEEECEEFPECDEHEEECDDFPECNENEEECNDFPECNENEEECDDVPECNENEEECDDFPECNENEEECDDFPECNENEEECDDFPECNENQEECEELPECNENEEECDDLPECDENEEECDDFPECDENQEECEELPECNQYEEECDEFPECDENGEECEDNVVEQPSGYINPNPASDLTLMTVTTEAARDASRFLAQASLGANHATITQVAAMGPEVWLEEQFTQPVGYTRPFAEFLMNRVEQFYEQNEGLSDEEFEIIYEQLGDPERYWVDGWWTSVMTSPDMVRQRVALALSEIFVISANVDELGTNNLAMVGYYDALLDNSFGNFRELLRAVSLSPAMGIYLSHIHNAKTDTQRGTFPDENYAREVMQLFSIGLFELNADGSRKLDAQGNPTPTYDQEDIREFAKIFTGLSWNIPGESGFGVMDIHELESESDPFLSPMKMYESHHEPGSKTLLNGQVVPAGQTGMQDIEAAIDNLFNHPNVGPFIGKQLIQRLVKSNPSPEYVARVSAAFNGETGAARGDMKALIRAILLDPEARSTPQLASATDGRLREPFVRVVNLMRAFNATSSDNTFSDDGYNMTAQIRQYVLSAPSVFNFFQPGYAPNGEIKDAGLVAPEFQITNASTIMEIKNLIYYSLQTGQVLAQSGQLPTEKLDFSAELQLADNSDALLDHLDTLMTYGTLTAETRAAVKTAVDALSDSRERVAMAVYLIAISPDFAIAI